MRNLKRALSLAMASVMLLGMMVVGTSAASYSDVTSKENVEAIEVLKTVGIMTGDEKGNFNPDKTVTRNEMAVVMANLMDYRVASYKGTSPFSDVPEWAEPYVAACYTNGIVAGTSATTYGGDDTVTTAQAALMLMKALGYFQYGSDFENDWQLATVKQGNKIDLFDDVESGVTEAMTRNDVAQLVLNTLESGMVEADNDVINVTAPGVSVEAGKVNYNYVTSSKSYAKAIKEVNPVYTTTTSTTGYIVELGEKLFDGDLKMNENVRDDFGRPGTRWEYKLDEIGTFSDQPIAVYTAKAKQGDLYALIGKDRIDDLDTRRATLSTYTNGRDTALTKTQVFDRNSTAAAGDSGKGVLTEVYMDDDGNVDIISIPYYVMQATADYNENKGTLDVDVITNPGTLDIVNSLDDDDFDLAGFQEDDYILYTASWNGSNYEIQTVDKADVVTGEVNVYSKEEYVTLDGTKYEYAKFIEADAAGTNSKETTYVVGDTASVVVDPYGYVLYVDDASISVGNYVYIDAIAHSSNLSTNTIADAYFSDGTNSEITVKKITDNSGATISAPATGNTPVQKWFSYTKDSDGKYTLKEANTSSGVVAVTAINNGKVNIVPGAKGDKNTIFVIKEDDDDISVYTGVANVPDVNLKDTAPSGTTIPVVFMKDKDKSDKNASVVFIDASSDYVRVKGGSKDSLLFVLKLDSTYVDKSDGEEVRTYVVLQDGVEKKIDTKEIWTVGDLYEDYSLDKDGYYEAGDAFQNDPTDDKFIITLTNGTISFSNDVLTVNDGSDKVYSTDSDTKVILVLRPSGTNVADLKSGLMKDAGAKYEANSTTAKSLASTLKGYNLTGKVYGIWDDASDSDYLTTVYVEVNEAVYVG